MIPLQITTPIKGGHVRNQLHMGKIELLEQALPTEIVDYLESIGARERLQHIYQQELQTPKVTTDLIIQDQDGHYLLIERKNYPFGLALPGGFVDHGEPLTDAALREGYEELFIPDEHAKKIVLTSQQPLILSDPDRDPRGHVITFVYTAQILQGSPHAHDDAKDLYKFTAEEILQLDPAKFAFPDHLEALQRVLG